MTDRMTNVKAMELAIATLKDTDFSAEALEKLQNITMSLAKKSARKSDKPTKTQIANEGIKTAILEAMEPGVQYTITDISKMVDGGYSVSKISALLRQLKESNLVTREEIKRVPYYSVV